MGRPKGIRNRGFEQRRAKLCRAIVPYLEQDGRPATLKHMADSAGIAVPTLRHYFGDRRAVLKAVLQQAHLDMTPRLAAPFPAGVPLKEALTDHLQELVFAWRSTPFRTLFMGSLTAGFEDAESGHVAVNELLEPALQVIERRLQPFVANGVLDAALNLRHASLILLSPILLALLHQDELNGVVCRPLDTNTLIQDVVAQFLRANQT